MSQVEERPQESKTSQDKRAAENLRLYSYMEDNFTRIFSLLAPIMSFSIQNENHIRQIMFSLQHPDAVQGTAEFDNREFVQNLLKSHERVAGSSNGRTSEESSADFLTTRKHVKYADQDEPKAGTSTDENEEQLKNSPGTSSKGQKSPDNDEKPRRLRKRKLNETANPVVIHCTDCNQVFVKGDGSYTRHLKEMKCSPHGCLECGKRFKKKSYLNTHMATHNPASVNPEEPASKKIRVKDDNEESDKPVDLSIKKENQSSDSEFFSFLHLCEATRSKDN